MPHEVLLEVAIRYRPGVGEEIAAAELDLIASLLPELLAAMTASAQMDGKEKDDRRTLCAGLHDPPGGQ